MSCSRCECAYLSIIIGIIFGVLLGVLYSLGYIATGVIFWAYLLFGVLETFISPLYAFIGERDCFGKCFCNYNTLFLVALAGTIITAAAGLIVVPFASVVATAIALALSTFFTVMLIVLVFCLTKCICRD